MRALDELGYVARIGAVSSVSGGSVFAASWLAARARGKTDAQFLAWIGDVLRRGFIAPALLHPRVVSLLWRSRTELLADAFDRLLFDGIGFKELPASPELCLNTTMLNNAQTGRFSQDGFSGAGIGELSEKHGYPTIDIANLSLGWAVAASAAFPFGLPPLAIKRERFGDVKLSGDLAKHRSVVFTDGGVLENTGIERMLDVDEKFGATHIISSDAGLRDHGWQPSLLGRLKAAAIFALSSDTLDRLLLVMNEKQNKSMRQLLYGRFVGEGARDRRRMWFLRLQNDWGDVIGPYASRVGLEEAKIPAIEAAIERSGIDLSQARKLYDDNGGTEGYKVANGVTTGFTALTADRLARLEGHARWQVHAFAKLYPLPA